MKKYKLTEKEIFLAVAFAFMAFIFSSREWLMLLNTMNPMQGFVVYEVIVFLGLMALSKVGAVIYHFNIKNLPLTTIGLFLITFSFFVIFNWENAYVQYVTTGSMTGASGIFYQSEDGMLWYFWHNVMNVQDIETARLLTFPVSIFFLTLFGGILVTKEVEIK